MNKLTNIYNSEGVSLNFFAKVWNYFNAFLTKKYPNLKTGYDLPELKSELYIFLKTEFVEKFKKGGNVASYLYHFCFKTILTSYLKQKNNINIYSEKEINNINSKESLENNTDKECLRGLIENNLKKIEQDVIKKYIYEEKSVSEISFEISKTTAYIRILLKNGMKKLGVDYNEVFVKNVVKNRFGEKNYRKLQYQKKIREKKKLKDDEF